jgi:CelD/BcsL family acetyltransferase involved in cellulose biosynthesis
MTDPAGQVQIEFASIGRWDELVQAFPGHTVFHRTSWLTAISEAIGLEPVLAVARRDGRCEALWPLLEQRLGPFRILGSPLPGWSTVYQGPLFKQSADPHVLLRVFMETPRLGRASYIYCKVCDEHRELDLTPHGFERQHRYRTYLVDLRQEEEALWAGLARRCRSAVRKAQRAGLTVVREEGTEYVDDFWKMSLDVFGRSGIKPTYSRDLLEKVAHGLSASASILVMSVMRDGQRLSTQLLPHDGHTAYAWAAASFSEHRKLSLSNILDWESILETRRMGLSRYDLVSIYGGPGFYKKSFGAEERATATHWERYGSPIARLGKRGYESLLRWRQRAR